MPLRAAPPLKVLLEIALFNVILFTALPPYGSATSLDLSKHRQRQRYPSRPAEDSAALPRPRRKQRDPSGPFERPLKVAVGGAALKDLAEDGADLVKISAALINPAEGSAAFLNSFNTR